MEKQILAVCEIADHKVRLVVAEFFHTSLNILKVEQVPTTGFDGRFVLDEDAIIKSIQSALLNASKNLQASIEQVLLVIPSLGMQKYSQKLNVEIADVETGISQQDIEKAYHMLMSSEVKVDKEVIFVQIARYIVNGVPFRKAPIYEKVERIQVEADIYVADKALTYQLAACVEKAGCEILDVVLDSWALAKETAIIEQSNKDVMIAIRLDKTSTQLNLFYQGKLISSEWLEMGYGQWVNAVGKFFNLPEDVSARLLYYNCELNKEDFSQYPVYLWAVNDQSKTCTQSEIMDVVLPYIEQWRKQLVRMCEPIIEKRSTQLLITGEGSLIEGLDSYIEQAFERQTKLYVPETIGARDPSLTVALGTFYAYQDMETWRRRKKPAINMLEFEEMIGSRKTKEPTLELAIGKKIKSFLQTKKD
jgi:cell division protein FtsA